MTTEEQAVDPRVFDEAGLKMSGSLTVMMLDTKRTFDGLVERHASSREARDRILNNHLYQYLSTSLAGTQDYMAMEKLLEVKDDTRYDLIVLDTPPTRNALDFLDAPQRLIHALDSAAIRWFMQAFDKSRRLSFNLVAKSVAVVLRGVGKLTGSGFLDQMAGLIVDLNDLFGGFRQRATRVAEAFRSRDFAYVMVTTPAPLALREVLYFTERLYEIGLRSDAFVINRLHRRPKAQPSRDEVQRALVQHELQLGEGAPERILRAVDEELVLADRDAKNLAALERSLPHTRGLASPTFVRIPALPSDVHDVQTLAGVAAILCPPDLTHPPISPAA
jgi:anion-transporting  ArsA/GET3 family ATPase